MSELTTIPNPDLEIIEGNKCRWSHADRRRYGWHNLHNLVRYASSYRAARVLPLEKRMDLAIADLEAVRHLTSLPWFSAMVVIRGQHVLFERYAPDFGPHHPHSIQSISKTLVNLIIGRLVEQGAVDLSLPVSNYIPEIGSGYTRATVQRVLNMDVVNEYSEDFTDPNATYYRHEEAMGWRLPRDPRSQLTERSFLVNVASADIVNRTGQTQYKDTNTVLLGWIAERASGRPLSAFLADIVDAAGIEGVFHMTTDRNGVPNLEGGVCVTARDLARYMSIFVRRGCGVSGERVGWDAFIESSLASGVPMPFPYEGIRYSNHLMVSGRSAGHGGWGGQYAMANVDTGTIGVFFSVLENEHATNRDYAGPLIRMLDSVTGRGAGGHEPINVLEKS
jgi:CubicO group peptidase (beta-lactamase class C family)